MPMPHTNRTRRYQCQHCSFDGRALIGHRRRSRTLEYDLAHLLGMIAVDYACVPFQRFAQIQQPLYEAARAPRPLEAKSADRRPPTSIESAGRPRDQS